MIVWRFSSDVSGKALETRSELVAWAAVVPWS
jgi:hypothetical protein